CSSCHWVSLLPALVHSCVRVRNLDDAWPVELLDHPQVLVAAAVDADLLLTRSADPSTGKGPVVQDS
ncbi:MAG TPA: hypothetical protein VGO16_19520, partial [Pseudonocardiaceae bacterium]|nr:hypothetical protein [Pseudonocardiaceae bacterium]